MIPRRGMTFTHPHLRVQTPGTPVAQWPRELREVTKVTEHAVYHRPAGSTGKATHYVTRAWFAAHGACWSAVEWRPPVASEEEGGDVIVCSCGGCGHRWEAWLEAGQPISTVASTCVHCGGSEVFSWS